MTSCPHRKYALLLPRRSSSGTHNKCCAFEHTALCLLRAVLSYNDGSPKRPANEHAAEPPLPAGGPTRDRLSRRGGAESTASQRRPDASSSCLLLLPGRGGRRTRGGERAAGRPRCPVPGDDPGPQELQEALGEDVHPALPAVRGEPAHRPLRGGLQEALLQVRGGQRGVHQPGPGLRVHPPGRLVRGVGFYLWSCVLDYARTGYIHASRIHRLITTSGRRMGQRQPHTGLSIIWPEDNQYNQYDQKTIHTITWPEDNSYDQNTIHTIIWPKHNTYNHMTRTQYIQSYDQKTIHTIIWPEHNTYNHMTRRQYE